MFTFLNILLDQIISFCISGDYFEAYMYALRRNDADIKKCQNIACQHPFWAYKFAHDIDKVDVEQCFHSCNGLWKLVFMADIYSIKSFKTLSLCLILSITFPVLLIVLLTLTLCNRLYDLTLKNDPFMSYSEIRHRKCTNIKNLQEIVCKSPEFAYETARFIKGADIEKCQKAACKDPYYAYLFALDIPGADIEKCQEAVCKDPKEAYWFAVNIPGADIEKCQKAACSDPLWAYNFGRDIPGADLLKIKQECPEISDYIDELVMEKVLI